MTSRLLSNPSHVKRLQFRSGARLLLLVGLLAGALAAVAQVNDAPVEARIPHPSTVFEGTDHRLHLAYELHLTNFYDSTGPLAVKSLSVFENSSTLPIATFSREELIKLLNSDETPKTGTDLVILPGKRKVLFLWLTLPSGVSPPRSLHHTIDFMDENQKIHTLAGAVTHLDQRHVLALGAPVRGHIWFVDEGPSNSKSHHWGSMLAQNGIVTIPQRFAIDFIGLNNAGHAVEASPDKLDQTSNNQWIGFGSEVLAVRDAVVRDMRDGVADHAPLSPLPKPSEITARGAYGNFIVLEIAPGIFAHYAHLQNGSIRAHIGQHVKKGDVLARVGDSGNAGGPHLHFQIADKPTFELSEGMPFVFSSMDLLGMTNEGAMLDPASTFHGQPSAEKNALPLYGDVVRF
jgi:hypothetical protein